MAEKLGLEFASAKYEWYINGSICAATSGRRNSEIRKTREANCKILLAKERFEEARRKNI